MKKRSAYWVALKIVLKEAKERKSLKPFRLLWQRAWYGKEYPYRLRTTLVQYIKFCRINKIAIDIPEEELA